MKLRKIGSIDEQVLAHHDAGVLHTVHPIIMRILSFILLWFDTPWLYPYPSKLHHWPWGNQAIAQVPEMQPWRIWANISYKHENMIIKTNQIKAQ